MITSILLAIAALAFVVLEVFLVSFGVLSIVAITCGVASAIVAFGVAPAFGWTMLAILVVGGPVCVAGAFKVLPHIPIGRKLYLAAPVSKPEQEDGGLAVGAVGKATTPLRPAGRADFDGEPVDVISDGTLIAEGEAIRVVDVSGNRVRVVHHQPES